MWESNIRVSAQRIVFCYSLPKYQSDSHETKLENQLFFNAFTQKNKKLCTNGVYKYEFICVTEEKLTKIRTNLHFNKHHM